MKRPKLRCDVTGLSRPECGCKPCTNEILINHLLGKKK